MANPRVFESKSRRPAKPDTRNKAGGQAFSMSPKHALAQMACTGCFGDTYYTTAGQQLDMIREASEACPIDYVCKVAIHARRNGFMKDTPAFLVAHAFARAAAVPPTETNSEENVRTRAQVSAAFVAVMDNAKMVRNFVQIVRSGTLGRSSLGTWGKRLVNAWFEKSSPDYLFRQSVGNEPSLADVMALSRPKPSSPERHALYAWLRQMQMGPLEARGIVSEDLPELVRAYENFKSLQGNGGVQSKPMPPELPFQMLDSLGLNTEQWAHVFRSGGYMFTRMNLNTALRQGVFDVEGMTDLIATRIADADQLRAARQFPYQLLSAYAYVDDAVPRAIKDALHTAMENAASNVPAFDGRTVVAVDGSGSMRFTAVTGGQPGVGRNSKISCADVAGLFGASILRANPDALMMRFTGDAEVVRCEPRDTVATIASQLTGNGGATNCSAPLELLNRRREHVDTFVIVSDAESWKDVCHPKYPGSVNAGHWSALKQRCPKARQVRINIVAGNTEQMPGNRPDCLLVGGFSDSVFDVVGAFTKGSGDPDFWVREIEAVALGDVEPVS